MYFLSKDVSGGSVAIHPHLLEGMKMKERRKGIQVYEYLL